MMQQMAQTPNPGQMPQIPNQGPRMSMVTKRKKISKNKIH